MRTGVPYLSLPEDLRLLYPSTTAASIAVAIVIPARAAGVLHNHALAAQLLAVQLVKGVVGVAGVLQFF